MKKYIAFLLCLIMILSLFSCGKENISQDTNKQDQNEITENISNNVSNNSKSANYDSVLEIYRLIVEKIPIVNQNPRALAFELGIQDEGEKESFLRLYSSIHQFYPSREQEDSLSPHYKLGCGYAIKDLNGDGVDELVLLTDEYRIIAVYSLINDIPTLLGSYIKRDLGWSFRNWIDAEGRIHVVRTDGLDLYHHSIFEISNGHLIELCTYGYDIFRENGVIVGKLYQTIHDNTVFITEQEVAELDRQYGNPINADEAGNITMVSAKLTFTSLYTEAEIAMEMYEAAINDKICVIDEHLGEIKLKACRFPSNNARIDECKLLTKAILDLDGDGINEYVIQSPDKDHIVLHYYGGKVFSYCFDKNNFYNLNADGSFYWSDSYESENWTHGLNQITFDGESLNIKEIYRIKHITPFDFYENLEFYVDGKQITREEFLDYHKSGTLVIFSPLDISCEYPISSEKACEIASNYWKIENGMSEGAAGTQILHKIVILEKPNSDTQGYRISWQWEGYRNHVPDPPYSLPPENVIIRHEEGEEDQ